jgi:hypothetical protein
MHQVTPSEVDDLCLPKHALFEVREAFLRGAVFMREIRMTSFPMTIRIFVYLNPLEEGWTYEIQDGFGIYSLSGASAPSPARAEALALSSLREMLQRELTALPASH